jgi:hypothetical protein
MRLAILAIFRPVLGTRMAILLPTLTTLATLTPVLGKRASGRWHPRPLWQPCQRQLISAHSGFDYSIVHFQWPLPARTLHSPRASRSLGTACREGDADEQAANS